MIHQQGLGLPGVNISPGWFCMRTTTWIILALAFDFATCQPAAATWVMNIVHSVLSGVALALIAQSWAQMSLLLLATTTNGMAFLGSCCEGFWLPTLCCQEAAWKWVSTLKYEYDKSYLRHNWSLIIYFVIHDLTFFSYAMHSGLA